MKVTSKILYQELRSVLAPLMKNSGFKTTKGGMLGWNRPTTGGTLSLWFQCDKWGWNERWGSQFTLQFSIAPAASNAMDPAGRFERIGYLLEGFEELDELRIKNNAVIQHLPGTINQQLVTGLLDDGSEYIVDGYKADDHKAIYGRDIWFNYYTIEDVRDWAHYFENNILHYVSLFENEVRSEQGKARVKFNQMISRVQATRDVEGKRAIYEDFVQNETDAKSRLAAQNLLNRLNGM